MHKLIPPNAPTATAAVKTHANECPSSSITLFRFVSPIAISPMLKDLFLSLLTLSLFTPLSSILFSDFDVSLDFSLFKSAIIIDFLNVKLEKFEISFFVISNRFSYV